jgi:hypothetical protein
MSDMSNVEAERFSAEYDPNEVLDTFQKKERERCQPNEE